MAQNVESVSPESVKQSLATLLSFLKVGASWTKADWDDKALVQLQAALEVPWVMDLVVFAINWFLNKKDDPNTPLVVGADPKWEIVRMIWEFLLAFMSKK